MSEASRSSSPGGAAASGPPKPRLIRYKKVSGWSDLKRSASPDHGITEAALNGLGAVLGLA